MLTEWVSEEVYAKRRRLARDYFLCVPQERVNLCSVTQGKGEFMFRRSYGLDALKCDAIACLAGWLYTMPEYRDWCERQGVRADDMPNVENYLGLDAGIGCGLFSSRLYHESMGGMVHLSDKQVALHRLNLLIDGR